MTPDPFIDLFLPGREPRTWKSQSEETHRPSRKDLVENKPQWIPVVHSSSSHLYKIVTVLYAWGPVHFKKSYVVSIMPVNILHVINSCKHVSVATCYSIILF